jgi:hypothetical protein
LTNLAETDILLDMTDLAIAPPSVCEEILRNDLPSKLQQALLRSVFDNYKSAHAACFGEYESEQARTLNGHVRHAAIERELLGIGARFRDAAVEAEDFKNGTGAYVKLTCGRVVLTQSAVQHPQAIVRSAEFRKSLASNPQMNLDFGDAKVELEQSSFLYVILLHGKDAKERSRPAFAHLVVPSSDCTSYVARIDLFKAFPSIVNEYIKPQEASLPEIQLVAKRRSQKKQA